MTLGFRNCDAVHGPPLDLLVRGLEKGELSPKYQIHITTSTYDVQDACHLRGFKTASISEGKC